MPMPLSAEENMKGSIMVDMKNQTDIQVKMNYVKPVFKIEKVCRLVSKNNAY